MHEIFFYYVNLQHREDKPRNEIFNYKNVSYICELFPNYSSYTVLVVDLN